MGKNNILEINGVKYDARTGATLHHSPKPKQPVQLHPAIKRPTMSDVVRNPGKHAGRAPKPSSTLMRKTVKKPAPGQRKHSAAQGHLDTVAARPSNALVPKKSAARVDDKLLAKAKRIPKSNLIQHFSPVTSDFKPATMQPLTATPQPVATPQPRPAATRPKAHSKPQTTAELLDNALRNARGHEEPAPAKRKKHRGLRITASIVIALVMIGIVGVQQAPNIKLHMASAKAGIHAGLPSERPAGFSMGQVTTSDGVVSTTFNSNSDQRHYTLVQQASDWDSQALRDNFVVGHDKSYKTESAAGRTVYVYGDHNATWVNAGIWYIVQSDGALSDRQLIDLASSL